MRRLGRRRPLWAAVLLAASAGFASGQAPPPGARVTPDGWFAPPAGAQAKPKLPKTISRVCVIPVRRGITHKMAAQIERKIKLCKQADAQLVVLDIDTSGGSASATSHIVAMLHDKLPGTYTVAFVNRRAYSAGAIIAIACNEIVLMADSVIGAAQRLVYTDSGPRSVSKEVRAKIDSYDRVEMRLLAKRGGYSEALAEAIVTLNREVWLIRHKKTRELRHVRANKWRGRVDIRYGIAEATSNPEADWLLLEVLVATDELLSMTADEAVKYGFARRIVNKVDGEAMKGLLRAFGAEAKPIVLTGEGYSMPATAPASKPAAVAVKAASGPAARGKPPKGVKTAADVYVIPIRDSSLRPMIDGGVYEAMKRKAVKCKARGAKLIVFDMDTGGGQVGAALDITRMIKSDLRDIHTVCYVRINAISAGAMIATACDEILMAEIGKLGDCAPISLQGTIEGVEREKIETIIRTEFRENAKGKYNTALAESMVSADIEVWKIRHKESGRIKYVRPNEQEGGVDLSAGHIEGRSTPDSAWEFLAVAVAKGKLLTMEPDKAKELGFAAAIIPQGPADDPLANLVAYYGLTGKPTVLEDDFAEAMAAFLTSPIVSSLLLMGAIFFASIEMRTPGFGVPGTVALICVGVLIGSRYVIGLANYWEIALLIVGLVLIVVEVFVIPGFGVAGISGIVCCLVAMAAMIVPNAPNEWPIPRTDLDWSFFTTGLLSLGLGFVGAMVLIGLTMRYFEKLPIASRLILAPAEAAVEAPAAEGSPIMHIHEDDTGTVEAMCRPVGKVRFGEELFDAMTEGDVIEPGMAVRVIRREGNRLIIEKA